MGKFIKSKMSKRTRSQKHKNSQAYRNDRHNKSPATQLMNSIEIVGCCSRCTEVIKWKIKYAKYKPLSQPKTCNICHEKVIKRAYYTICENCADKRKLCYKCAESKEVIQKYIHKITKYRSVGGFLRSIL